jgi:hypothetical protein
MKEIITMARKKKVKVTRKPFRIECSDCFYNDGTCEWEPKDCYYLVLEKELEKDKAYKEQGR